jgi:hypothetical protein
VSLSFTSGQPARPATPTVKTKPEAYEARVLAQLYGLLADLFLMAKPVRDLAEKQARLKAKLDDPALARHPKRAEYVEVYQQRQQEIADLETIIDRQARRYVDEFPAVWQRLSAETRERMYRDETDFPQERSVPRLAVAVWAWLKSERFLWPSQTEAPFIVLATLGALAVANFAR